MKLKLLAAAIALGFTVPVCAQTNITIYGLVDAGIQVSSFGGSPQTNLASGIAEGTRIGFKGTEDLGGGYKAIFTLESRVELDTGGNANGYPTSNVGTALTRGLPPPLAARLTPVLQPEEIINPTNARFDRTAMVGLITPVGAFLLGRQYTPGYEVLAMADTFEAGTAGGWGNITGGTGGFATTGTAIRANDALQYRIQLPNGFGASAMYAFSNSDSAFAGDGTGSLNSSKRFWGANARYAGNGWNVGAAYNSEQDQVGNKSLTTLTAGGSYATGNAKFFAGYHRMKNDNSILFGAVRNGLIAAGTPVPNATAVATIVGNNAKLDANSYTLGMHYAIGSGRIMTSVSHTKDKLATDASVTLYALGYDYNLSKRTDLYAVVAHADNKKTAQYGLGGAGYTGGFTSQAGQDANAVQLGIRHRF